MSLVDTGALRCEPLRVAQCQPLGYEQTWLPNLFGQASQEEAAVELPRFTPLLDIHCSARLLLFLCSLYAPPCTRQGAQPPCRAVCEDARDGCAPIMKNLAIPWPDSFNCSRFHSPDTGLCLSEIPTSMTTLPPTTRTTTPPRRACYSDWCSAEKRAEISTRLREDLEVHFSQPRYSVSPEEDGGTYKARARTLIEARFRGLRNFRFLSQNFTVGTSSELLNPANVIRGVHLIGVLPGERWRTSDDKIILLGAHYDTGPDTDGVDDNGSGMAALLEVARLMNEDCNIRLNSVIFVAFDLEEDWMVSSTNKFLHDHLIKEVLSQFDWPRFKGAIILDTIMNYDAAANSQTLPFGFEAVFKELHAELVEKNFQGTFLLAAHRKSADKQLADLLERSWVDGDLLKRVVLPDDVSVLSRYFSDFTRSNHFAFWDAVLPSGGLLPAVFLTDSAEFRGYMRQCYHRRCDNVAWAVDADNLAFLANTTASLANALATAALCSGRSPASRPVSDLTSSLIAVVVGFILTLSRQYTSSYLPPMANVSHLFRISWSSNHF